MNATPSGACTSPAGGQGGSEARRVRTTSGPSRGPARDVGLAVAFGNTGDLGAVIRDGTRCAKTVCRVALCARHAAQGRVGGIGLRHVVALLVTHPLLSANTSAPADAVRPHPPGDARPWHPAEVTDNRHASLKRARPAGRRSSGPHRTMTRSAELAPTGAHGHPADDRLRALPRERSPCGMTVATLLLALLTATNPSSGGGASSDPILLDFHADWCGPCQKMRPAIDQLTRKGLPIRSVNIDRSPAIARKYGVTAVPTFVVIDRSGRALDRTSGLQPAAVLERFYVAAAAKAQPNAPAPDDAPAASRRDGNDADGSAALDRDAEPPARPVRRIRQERVRNDDELADNANNRRAEEDADRPPTDPALPPPPAPASPSPIPTRRGPWCGSRSSGRTRRASGRGPSSTAPPRRHWSSPAPHLPPRGPGAAGEPGPVPAPGRGRPVRRRVAPAVLGPAQGELRRVVPGQGDRL